MGEHLHVVVPSAKRHSSSTPAPNGKAAAGNGVQQQDGKPAAPHPALGNPSTPPRTRVAVAIAWCVACT